MIYVEQDNTDAIFRYLTRLNPRMRAAANRAVRKTVTWAYNSIIKQGAAAADINQRGLRKGIELPRGQRAYRRDINARKQDAEASVYTGFNPIKTHYVGKIPKWRRGTAPRVRGHRFPGAFTMTFDNGYRGVFRRNAAGKLEEETVDLTKVDQAVRVVRTGADRYLKGVLATELQIELEKLKRL